MVLRIAATLPSHPVSQQSCVFVQRLGLLKESIADGMRTLRLFLAFEQVVAVGDSKAVPSLGSIEPHSPTLIHLIPSPCGRKLTRCFRSSCSILTAGEEFQTECLEHVDYAIDECFVDAAICSWPIPAWPSRRGRASLAGRAKALRRLKPAPLRSSSPLVARRAIGTRLKTLLALRHECPRRVGLHHFWWPEGTEPAKRPNTSPSGTTKTILAISAEKTLYSHKTQAGCRNLCLVSST